MVGVGVPLTRELGDGRKLVLTMDWESDVGLVQGKKVHGDLAGLGCMIYSLKLSRGDGQPDELLQEFRYTGGSSCTSTHLTGVVRLTFEGWYERLKAGVPPAKPRPTVEAAIPQAEQDEPMTPEMQAAAAKEREESMKRAQSMREEVMLALAELEHIEERKEAAALRPSQSPPPTREPVQLPEGVSSPPDGYRLFSTDGKIAQKGNKLVGSFLAWDHSAKAWANRGGGLSSSHLYAYGAGEDGRGAHYDWDEKRGLWVPVRNPPKPPPRGATLSSTLSGFADAYLDGRLVYYEWREDEQQWIPVDPIPSGFRDAYSERKRLEAVSLDDYHLTIHWDGKRRSWIDPRTDGPPALRPPPPAPAVLTDEAPHGDLAKVDGGDGPVYYLWNKHRQRWVRLLDPPPGFHRGEDPKEAYQVDGSAFDRWVEWDSIKEAWVDFDPGRRLNIRGRIQ